MKRKITSFFTLAFLTMIFANGFSQPVKVSPPEGTILEVWPTDPRSIGITATTFKYTDPTFPYWEYDSSCIYWGVNDTLFGVINGANNAPPNSNCSGMSDLIYDPASSDSRHLVFRGTTNYKYLNTSNVWVTNPVPVQMIISVDMPDDMQFRMIGGYLLARVSEYSQTFRLLVQMYALSPADAQYFSGSPGQLYSPIKLFDMLHTDPNTSICTNWDGGSFFKIPFYAEVFKTEPLCNGSSDGELKVEYTGGTQPVGILWSTGSPNPVISDITAGNYWVRIFDFTQCVIQKYITVNEPAPLTLADSVKDISCFGAGNGEVSVHAEGGTMPYRFQWSNGGTDSVSVADQPGTYTVVVTDDHGCTAYDTLHVNEPEKIILHAEITEPSCNGTSDGSLIVSATGGIAPFNFLWDSGSTEDTLTNLSAGNYIVTATDQNNCTETDTFIVQQPEPLAIHANVTDVSCYGGNDGAVSLLVSGGTQPYSFAWNDNAITQNRENLSAGSYSVTVTDNHGCGTDFTVQVTEPSEDSASFQFEITHKTVTFSNQSSQGSYTWNFGDGQSSDEQNPEHTYLNDGTYNVCLTVTTNCGEWTQCRDVVINTVGVPSALARQCRLYPNPAADYLTAQWPSEAGLQRISVLDLSGRVVFQDVSDNSGSRIIDISNLPSGVWQLQMVFRKETVRIPFIVIR